MKLLLSEKSIKALNPSIGGFLAGDCGRPGTPIYPFAEAFSTARAFLTSYIFANRPSRVYLPFFTCNALLEPFIRQHIPIEFYDVGLHFELDQMPASVGENELVVWVNYFGQIDSDIRLLIDLYGDRLLVDDTQAFFAGPRNNCISFNSARKFFGVPDGAFAFGVDSLASQFPPNSDPYIEHLLARESGNPNALGLYREYEHTIGINHFRMSELSRSLLTIEMINYAIEARLRNFRALEEGLSDDLNRWWTNGDSIPSHLVVQTEQRIDWNFLHANGLFAAQYWGDVVTRENSEKFPNSVYFAEHLLALPIDHRYDESDMHRLADFINECGLR